jgi:hypothetical protein
MFLAAEQPGRTITAILPAASETGTGVPLAAACRPFDTPGAAPLSPYRVATIEIPLRTADGRPRGDGAVNAAFRAAARAAQDRPIVYLTHGTKTGLIAPVEPPAGVDVIVDACQARIAPQTMAAYLRRGWPVVVTGSKFFGGPAFSGALLMPKDRGAAACTDTANLGTVLRWVAALGAMAAFRPVEPDMAEFLRAQAVAVERELARIPAAELIGNLPPRGAGWADLPSIFTFAVRNPADRRQFLTADALRPLYRGLATQGVLLGQPVNLGPFGGLRLAFGARDVTAATERHLPHAFDVLRRAIVSVAHAEILAAE